MTTPPRIQLSAPHFSWVHDLWERSGAEERKYLLSIVTAAAQMREEETGKVFLNDAEGVLLQSALLDGLRKPSIAKIQSITARDLSQAVKVLLSRCQQLEYKTCSLISDFPADFSSDFAVHFDPPVLPIPIRLRTEEELKTEEGARWHPFVESHQMMYHDFDFMRSGRAFFQLSGSIAEGKLLPHIAAERTMTALYAASGADLSPLEIFHGLILSGKIDHAKAIYTEVNPDTRIHLIKLLKNLEATGFYERVDVAEPHFFEGSTKEKEISETTMTIVFKGVPMTIVFALNRSGDDYYRQEYFAEADLVIAHDIEIDHPVIEKWYPLKMGIANFLAQYFVDRAKLTPEQRKRQAIVLENLSEHKKSGRFMDISLLDYDILWAPYGHRSSAKIEGETGLPYYTSAMVITPNQPLFDALSADQQALLIDFFHLSLSGFMEEFRALPDVEKGFIEQRPYEFSKVLHDGKLVNDKSKEEMYTILVDVLKLATSLRAVPEFRKEAEVLILMSLRYLLMLPEEMRVVTVNRLIEEETVLANYVSIIVTQLDENVVAKKEKAKAAYDYADPSRGGPVSHILYQKEDEDVRGPSLTFFVKKNLDDEKRKVLLMNLEDYIGWVLNPKFYLRNPFENGIMIIQETKF